VGQQTDLDKLVLRIWTDGSVAPGEALTMAVEILRSQLAVFGGEVAAMPTVEEKVPVTVIAPRASEEAAPAEPEGVQMNLDGLELSSRVLHSLQEEGIDSINALLALSERDLKKVGGIGEKSLEEITDQLSSRGLKLKE
jgi:DNA-directed RNA polymerase subunit alpha